MRNTRVRDGNTNRVERHSMEAGRGGDSSIEMSESLERDTVFKGLGVQPTHFERRYQT